MSERKVHLAITDTSGASLGVGRCGFVADDLIVHIFDARYFTVSPANVTCQSCITLHNVDKREAEEVAQAQRDHDDLLLGRKVRDMLDHYVKVSS